MTTSITAPNAFLDTLRAAVGEAHVLTDGDLSAFQKMFGGLTAKEPPPPAPAPAAADAATMEPAKPVHTPRAKGQAHPAKTVSTTGTLPTTRILETKAEQAKATKTAEAQRGDRKP